MRSKVMYLSLVALLAMTGCGGSGSSSGSTTGSGSGSGGGGSTGGTTATATATVNFGAQKQVIRGFGGSTAWLGTLTTPQATALYSQSTGLGLSILRVRIDPSGSASNNFVTGQWTEELNNAEEVKVANSNAIVFASPWTPPPAWKTSSTSQPFYSGSPACTPVALCGGYLDPSHYADYADYLEDFVTYFKDNGVNLYGISMQNEPDWSAQPGENYESCGWTAAQMDAWIAGDAATLTTKLIMPEAFSFNSTMYATALADPNAADKISIIAGHLYGSAPTYQTLAENAGKDVWMTEHFLSPAGGSGAQPTISDALKVAEEIHTSMVTAEFNAYVWWWIWDDPADGVNYGLIDSSTSNPTPTYDGYAMGQFSRFIQPGYYRYDATANPTTDVYVSAYAGNNHYVIVAINGSSAPVNQTFNIQGATVTSMTPWQTSASGGLQQQSGVTVGGDSFTYSLPAQSITTFVQ
jgi:glucuronoarabinoxylan endo-1,4-beta-xylanase